MTTTDTDFKLQLWSSQREENYKDGKYPAPYGLLQEDDEIRDLIFLGKVGPEKIPVAVYRVNEVLKFLSFKTMKSYFLFNNNEKIRCMTYVNKSIAFVDEANWLKIFDLRTQKIFFQTKLAVNGEVNIMVSSFKRKDYIAMGTSTGSVIFFNVDTKEELFNQNLN